MLRQVGLPNSYTLTKHMCEELLDDLHCAAFPVAVVRPSIIGAIARSPVPGYFGNAAGVTSATLAFATGDCFSGARASCVRGSRLLVGLGKGGPKCRGSLPCATLSSSALAAVAHHLLSLMAHQALCRTCMHAAAWRPCLCANPAFPYRQGMMPRGPKRTLSKDRGGCARRHGALHMPRPAQHL